MALIESSSLHPTTPQPRTVRWPVRIISLLLSLQAMGLLTICLYLLKQIDWEREWSAYALSATAFETLSFIIFFLPLVALGIFSAIGFLFFWRVAWLTALIVQSVSLFGCLAIYFESYLKDYNFIYLIMLACIVMVLYLNNNDIRVMFQAKPPVDKPLTAHENDPESAEAANPDKIEHEQPDY
ncbi:MAG: hypothetical protein U0350_14435 [Caldilineaceae bacterium]